MREAYDNGIALYKTGFRHVAALALAGSALANAPRLFDVGRFELSDALRGGVPDVSPALLVWVAAAQLAAMFFQLAVTARLHAVATCDALLTSDALAGAARRYPALLVVLAIVLTVTALGVAAATLVAGGLVAAFVALVPLPELAELQLLLVVLTTLFALVLALPLVTVLVYWYFAFLLVVTEERGALSALRRSFRLVRGRLWRMKLALSVVYLVFLAALLLAEAMAAAAAALLGWANVPEGVVGYVVVAAGGAVAGPIPIAGSLALLYYLTDAGAAARSLPRRS